MNLIILIIVFCIDQRTLHVVWLISNGIYVCLPSAYLAYFSTKRKRQHGPGRSWRRDTNALWRQWRSRSLSKNNLGARYLIYDRLITTRTHEILPKSNIQRTTTATSCGYSRSSRSSGNPRRSIITYRSSPL